MTGEQTHSGPNKTPQNWRTPPHQINKKKIESTIRTGGISIGSSQIHDGLRRLDPGRRKAEGTNYLLAKNRRRCAARRSSCGSRSGVRSVYLPVQKKDAHRGDAVCLRVAFYNNGATVGCRVVAALPTPEFLMIFFLLF